jgi:hypothetical protein
MIKRTDPAQQCMEAYRMRRTPVMRRLNHICSHPGNISIWSSIRHYVGRLGSWTKAARTVVCTARHLPSRFRGFDVRRLSNPLPASISWKIGFSDLENELQALFPVFHSSTCGISMACFTESYQKSLQRNKKDERKRSDFQPKVHAEALLAEYFSSKNLRFVADDRYIGCSKPSCYCCDLYLKHSSPDFISRPCHGNVWPKWQPPCFEGLQSQHSVSRATQILTSMVSDVDHDIRRRIMAGNPPGKRRPDSNTGLSSSITKFS